MVTDAPPIDVTTARTVAARVVDPEIPVLTIEDLGILRDVSVVGERVVVSITPTYSGCPAMRQIEEDVSEALAAAGFDDVEVVRAHHPAWSTSWISPAGHEKLEAFGIAPPLPAEEPQCPRCKSTASRTVSRFGSTACKALMVCSSCGEPFDLFKEL